MLQIASSFMFAFKTVTTKMLLGDAGFEDASRLRDALGVVERVSFNQPDSPTKQTSFLSCYIHSSSFSTALGFFASRDIRHFVAI